MTDQIRVGLLAGYSHLSFDADQRASSGAADNYHFGSYAGTQWGDLGLRSGLAYTWSDIETNRAVIIPTLTNRLNADYDAGLFKSSVSSAIASTHRWGRSSHLPISLT